MYRPSVFLIIYPLSVLGSHNIIQAQVSISIEVKRLGWPLLKPSLKVFDTG